MFSRLTTSSISIPTGSSAFSQHAVSAWCPMDDTFAEKKTAGDTTRTPIGSLGLKTGDAFGYWFDFGDDWWHQINVVAIEHEVPRGNFPRVTKRVGKSPPQYIDWDQEG